MITVESAVASKPVSKKVKALEKKNAPAKATDKKVVQGAIVDLKSKPAEHHVSKAPEKEVNPAMKVSPIK